MFPEHMLSIRASSPPRSAARRSRSSSRSTSGTSAPSRRARTTYERVLLHLKT